jgi:hypothetical protein
MKRTISTLALAAPLAIAALSLGSAPAMAETPGPSSDKIAAATPGPVNPHLPHGPGDTAAPADDPDPEPLPDGPDDKVSIPQPCPTDEDCTKDPGDEVPHPTPCGTPGDREDPPVEDEPEPTTLSAVPADEDEDEPGDDVIPRPNCIDAGAASSEESLDLTWLMVGSGLITATGAAYAVRRRMRTEA